MTVQRNSYRQIMKATSLFGGVQFFQILISVVRSKFVAILLGPTGMGIVGLLTSATALVGGLTNLGLGTSAVKNISEARTTGNEDRISNVIFVLRRLVWMTGLLGVLVTLFFSSWLSEVTFGNRDYTLAFVWISVTLLFNQLSSGELVLLQGMRRLQQLAKANFYGSLIGLFISIPLYYRFGVQGIVPVIIVTSFITLFFSRYFSPKIKTKKVEVPKSVILKEGKNMMVMGIMISLSGLITIIATYILRIFINHTGDVADVGQYSAGFTIINTYVGMIFTAMGTDYYPRLAAIASDNVKCKESINQQAEIALLILAPILIFFLVFINYAVILLYSTQFLAIKGMVYWASLGIFFKAVSWSIAFVFLAKGDGPLFFWNELIGSAYSLAFNIVGYYLGGLNGLGISFLVSYMVYFIQVFAIVKVKYNFSFYKEGITIFLIQFLLALLSFSVVNLIEYPYAYVPGIILIGASSWYSFRELEKRIGLKDMVQVFIRKQNKNN